jgi:hypothetical protein
MSGLHYRSKLKLGLRSQHISPREVNDVVAAMGRQGCISGGEAEFRVRIRPQGEPTVGTNERRRPALLFARSRSGS